MIVNLSRLGKSGTGMWVYSIKFIEALDKINSLDVIICAEMHQGFFKKYNCKIITVPDLVANTSKVSRLKPVLWFMYSYYLSLKCRFLYGNKFIVSTTHHLLPYYKKQIITIHDLRPYYYPDSKLQKIYFRRILARQISLCSSIITVSNSVRVKIAETYKVDIDKISVIYNSIDVSKYHHVRSAKEKLKSNLLLAVGASWKHKNIHTLLNNYETWFHQYKLLIICGDTEYSKELKNKVEKLKLCQNVSFLTNISFDELTRLYSEARVLIYPSIDEGFGIPPIESFASGTPVIVSDIPVFREILGSHAYFINPSDKAEWISAFKRLNHISDKEILSLSDHASKFSSDNMRKMVEEWLNRISV